MDEKIDRMGETTAPYGRRPAKRARKKAPVRSDPFGSPPTIEELARLQGVQPFSAKSLERATFWTEDEDVEEFIRAAKGDRYRAN